MIFSFSIEVDETVEGGLIASTTTYEGEASIERASQGASYAWKITGIELDCLDIKQEADGTWKRRIATWAAPDKHPIATRVAVELMRQCACEIDREWHANAREHAQARESV